MTTIRSQTRCRTHRGYTLTRDATVDFCRTCREEAYPGLAFAVGRCPQDLEAQQFVLGIVNQVHPIRRGYGISVVGATCDVRNSRISCEDVRKDANGGEW